MDGGKGDQNPVGPSPARRRLQKWSQRRCDGIETPNFCFGLCLSVAADDDEEDDEDDEEEEDDELEEDEDEDEREGARMRLDVCSSSTDVRVDLRDR